MHVSDKISGGDLHQILIQDFLSNDLFRIFCPGTVPNGRGNFFLTAPDR